jgi:hypothetical protein
VPFPNNTAPHEVQRLSDRITGRGMGLAYKALRSRSDLYDLHSIIIGFRAELPEGGPRHRKLYYNRPIWQTVACRRR